VRFIALGRLDRRKGLDIALEALAEVPEADLAIVGDGEERAALEALASQLGVSERVRFVGYAEDVRSAIAESDVALSSARQEGLGVALLEAMAMERPVVALPTGGVPEVVRDGETGWLASNGSARALARAMQASIDAPDELRRRGAAARARVEDHFSVISMRRGYEAVYARLRP
jgi:glycosyltransferase involved in cell wall biosynthesis